MKTAFVVNKNNRWLVRVFCSSNRHTATSDTFEFEPDAIRRRDLLNGVFQKINVYIEKIRKEERGF